MTPSAPSGQPVASAPSTTTTEARTVPSTGAALSSEIEPLLRAVLDEVIAMRRDMQRLRAAVGEVIDEAQAAPTNETIRGGGIGAVNKLRESAARREAEITRLAAEKDDGGGLELLRRAVRR